MKRLQALLFALATIAALQVRAAGGPLGIDHPITYDNDGLVHRKLQLFVEDATLLALVGGALWEGGDSRLGKTYWRAIDASLLGVASSSALKYAFSRSRPAQSSNPDLWLQGKGHYSFPSGEVTFVTAAVTPFVIEYAHDHPAVWALEALPLYDAIARVKIGGHWQTDVLAGFALGTAAGYLASKPDQPYTLLAMPRGIAIGFKKQF